LTILEVTGLTKRFGGLLAVDEVDFSVEPGQIMGIIGPNGAGKTTLYNAVTGFFRPTSGRVIFEGRDVTGLKANRIARLGLVRTFQLVNLIGGETAYQNLRTAHYLQRRVSAVPSVFHTRASLKDEESVSAKTEELMKRMGLYEVKDEVASSLPHGLQRLLGICIALAARPKLLLLDEPTAGMSTAETETIMEQIRRIRDEGVTVMLVEHDMKVIMNICDWIIVLNFGAKIAEGTPQEVSGNRKVITAYLGSERGRR